jgi:hypothetical protein
MSSGVIDGALATTSKQVVPIKTAVDGRGFALTLPSRLGAISGAGVAAEPIDRCVDIPRGGKLAGPRVGDEGDWFTPQGAQQSQQSQQQVQQQAIQDVTSVSVR